MSVLSEGDLEMRKWVRLATRTWMEVQMQTDFKPFVHTYLHARHA